MAKAKAGFNQSREKGVTVSGLPAEFWGLEFYNSNFDRRLMERHRNERIVFTSRNWHCPDCGQISSLRAPYETRVSTCSKCKTQVRIHFKEIVVLDRQHIFDSVEEV